MGKAGPTVDPLDLYAVDWWAVDLVVKEGVLMNLNATERVIAAWRMKESGIKCPDIAIILKTDELGVRALWKRYARAGLHRQGMSVG